MLEFEKNPGRTHLQELSSQYALLLKVLKIEFQSGCLLSHTDPPHNTPDFKNGNLTFVSATLGRTATFKCEAKHLVGQKTVSGGTMKIESYLSI
jgi:hypothetical protein